MSLKNWLNIGESELCELPNRLSIEEAKVAYVSI